MPVFNVFNHEPDVRTFAPGEVIFAEGQASDGRMYAVLEGEVDIVRQRLQLDTILPGGVFGEMGLLDQEPRSAAAIAKVECRVAVITEARFKRLVSQNPHFALDMMRLLVERIRHQLES